MYYNISSGDTCASVTIAMGISLTDFYFLNPEVNATTCANLELGESYCVKAVGNIASYPGYGLVILDPAAKAHITDGIIIDEQMHQDLRTHAEGFHSLQAAMWQPIRPHLRGRGLRLLLRLYLQPAAWQSKVPSHLPPGQRRTVQCMIGTLPPTPLAIGHASTSTLATALQLFMKVRFACPFTKLCRWHNLGFSDGTTIHTVESLLDTPCLRP